MVGSSLKKLVEGTESTGEGLAVGTETEVAVGIETEVVESSQAGTAGTHYGSYQSYQAGKYCPVPRFAASLRKVDYTTS